MALDSVEAVKQLRERTGAGIIDCRTALRETSGDLEKAVDTLRKKGVAQAVKRAGRQAKEGLIAVRISGGKAAIVEVNCETDFVARTDDFAGLAALAAEETLSHGEDSATVSDKLSKRLAELSAKIGEKILVRRARRLESKDGHFFHYVHSNRKLAVVLELSCAAGSSGAVLEELGKNLSMQVAASNPICVSRLEVPPAVLEREKAIFREEVKNKPEAILEKIVQGKLEKFYQTSCLTEQPYIRDDKTSVGQLVAQTEKKAGGKVEIRRFVRFQLGENLPES